MKTGKENLIEKYKNWIGSFLIVAIVIESVYFLWRKNYLEPSIVKRIEVMEDKVDSLRNLSSETGSIKPAEINKVISESKTGEQGKEEPKTETNIPAKTADLSSSMKNGKVNINTASVTELDTLPRIGIATANKIIEYRKKSGGFKNIEEIKNVKGIGDATFNQMKDKISI